MTELKRIGLNCLVGLPLAGGMIAWAWLSPTALPLWLTIALWAGALAIIGYLFYRSSAWLFGPVLFYELIRGARSPRVPLLRIIYALTLLLASFVVYFFYASGPGSERSVTAVFEGARVDPNRMAAFAATFFVTFLALQMTLVFLLTPAFVAGSIAGEKQSGTLDFLLASDLSTREIILGKLVSRLANLLLLLMTGLPVLSFLQMMGGVDPNVLLAAFAVTLLTLLSQGAMSMAASVLTRRPLDAVFSIYVISAVYMLLTYSCFCCSMPGLGPMSYLGWLASGNPLSAWTLTAIAMERGSLDVELPNILGRYAVFHGVVFVGCLTLAMLRLRARSSWKYRAATPRSRPRVRPAVRPRRVREPRPRRWRPWIGERAPMMWKELEFEPGIELPAFVKGLLVALACIVMFIMLLSFLCTTLSAVGSNKFGEETNKWVRICSGIVAQLLFLGIALRGSSTFSKEREQQTYDSLLTTPLSDQEILWAKWLSCLWTVRWWSIALGVVYAMGLLTGGVNPLALPLCLLACAVHAAFAASLGMYCSVLSTNTLRSTIATIVALVAVGGGHWLLAPVLQRLTNYTFGKEQADLVYSVHLWGLTPPCNVAAVTFVTDDLSPGNLDEFVAYRLMPGLCGILLYGAGTLGLLWAIRRRLLYYRE